MRATCCRYAATGNDHHGELRQPLAQVGRRLSRPKGKIGSRKNFRNVCLRQLFQVSYLLAQRRCAIFMAGCLEMIGSVFDRLQ
jgi:hypothetical protein